MFDLDTLAWGKTPGRPLRSASETASPEDLRRYATDLADLPRMCDGDLTPTREVAALSYRLMICGSTIRLIYKQLREAFGEL